MGNIELEWVKLNTNSVRKTSSNMAAAGGILRNSTGEWNRGFTYNIGDCSSIMAELWSIVRGLNLFKVIGFHMCISNSGLIGGNLAYNGQQHTSHYSSSLYQDYLLIINPGLDCFDGTILLKVKCSCRLAS